MAEAVLQTSMQQSRLIRSLDELSLVKRRPDLSGLVDKLSAMMELSDTLKLSEGLGAINKLSAEGVARSAEDVKAECVEVRTSIIQSVVKSFVPDAGSLSFNLPLTEARGLSDEQTTVAGWQRFYALHQSDMEQKLNRLRAKMRQAVTGFSDSLAQLAALDKLMQESIADHARKRFAAVPRLLENRYQQLQAAYPDDDTLQLQQIHCDMQELLLAELDVRMQPILGLVEAYEEEVSKSS